MSVDLFVRKVAYLRAHAKAPAIYNDQDKWLSMTPWEQACAAAAMQLLWNAELTMLETLTVHSMEKRLEELGMSVSDVYAQRDKWVELFDQAMEHVKP